MSRLEFRTGTAAAAWPRCTVRGPQLGRLELRGDSADGLESSEGALARESAGGSWLSSGISAGAIGQSAHTWPLHMVFVLLCGTVTGFQKQMSQDSPSNDGIRKLGVCPSQT